MFQVQLIRYVCVAVEYVWNSLRQDNILQMSLTSLRTHNSFFSLPTLATFQHLFYTALSSILRLMLSQTWAQHVSVVNTEEKKLINYPPPN